MSMTSHNRRMRTNTTTTMSLEERTLVVRNLNNEFVTKEILSELFNQAGPVVNVVLRPDFAFIEFRDQTSVAYSLALFDCIQLFGKTIVLSPKIQIESNYRFVNALNSFNTSMSFNPNFFLQFVPQTSQQRGEQREQRSRVHSRDTRDGSRHSGGGRHDNYDNSRDRARHHWSERDERHHHERVNDYDYYY